MSNDTTIVVRFPTGANLYAQIEAPDGTFWNGTIFTTFSVASWVSFAISTLETPLSSGRFVCQFPISASAGNYNISIFIRAGGSPASTDAPIGTSQAYWNGSTFGGSASAGTVIDKTGFALASNGFDTVILEASAGGAPAINGRQGLALIFDAAVYGLLSGIGGVSPIVIQNPGGTIDRATVESDEVGNRTSVTFNNLP